jgi:hypothetical protein
VNFNLSDADTAFFTSDGDTTLESSAAEAIGSAGDVTIIGDLSLDQASAVRDANGSVYDNVTFNLSDSLSQYDSDTTDAISNADRSTATFADGLGVVTLDLDNTIGIIHFELDGSSPSNERTVIELDGFNTDDSLLFYASQFNLHGPGTDSVLFESNLRSDDQLNAHDYDIFILDQLQGTMLTAENIAGAFSVGSQNSINSLIDTVIDIDMIFLVESQEAAGGDVNTVTNYGIWYWNDSATNVGFVDSYELTNIGNLIMTRSDFLNLSEQNFQVI